MEGKAILLPIVGDDDQVSCKPTASVCYSAVRATSRPGLIIFLKGSLYLNQTWAGHPSKGSMHFNLKIVLCKEGRVATHALLFLSQLNYTQDREFNSVWAAAVP